MESLKLFHWIYTACRMGRSGTAGYQTWCATEGITQEEETELQHLTSFFATSEDGEVRRSFGFKRLTSGSKRWAIFSMTQGGTDDLGRPSYLSEAFLCDDIARLPRSPWAYLHPECFRSGLSRKEASNTSHETSLPFMAVAELESRIVNAGHGDSRQWLADFLRGREEAACGMLALLLGTSPPSPLLVAGDTEEVHALAALAWEVATPAQRASLSLCTLFSERNATTFSISGWPLTLGNPGTAYFNRFSGVVQWSQPQERRILAGAPQAVVNQLIDKLVPFLGPGTASLLGTYGLSQLDERLKAFTLLTSSKPISMVSDCEREVQRLVAEGLLQLAYEKHRQRLITMVTLVVKNRAESLSKEVVAELCKLIGPEDSLALHELYTLRYWQGVFYSPTLPDQEEVMDVLRGSAQHFRDWLKLEQNFLTGAPPDACGWVLALKNREANQWLNEALPGSFSHNFAVSLWKNVSLHAPATELLLKMPESARSILIKDLCTDPPAGLPEQMAALLVQSPAAFQAWLSEPRWLGICLGRFQAASQQPEGWSAALPFIEQLQPARRNEFLREFQKHAPPQTLSFADTLKLLELSDGQADLRLLRQWVEENEEGLQRVLSGGLSPGKEPDHLSQPKLWAVWTLAKVKAEDVSFVQTRYWKMCVEHLQRLQPDFQKTIVRELVTVLAKHPLIETDAGTLQKLVRYFKDVGHEPDIRENIHQAFQRPELLAFLNPAQRRDLGLQSAESPASGPAPAPAPDSFISPPTPPAAHEVEEKTPPPAAARPSAISAPVTLPSPNNLPKPKGSDRYSGRTPSSGAAALTTSGALSDRQIGNKIDLPRNAPVQGVAAQSALSDSPAAAYDQEPEEISLTVTSASTSLPLISSVSSLRPGDQHPLSENGNETLSANGTALTQPPPTTNASEILGPRPQRSGYGAIFGVSFFICLAAAAIGYFLGVEQTDPQTAPPAANSVPVAVPIKPAKVVTVPAEPVKPAAQHPALPVPPATVTAQAKASDSAAVSNPASLMHVPDSTTNDAQKKDLVIIKQASMHLGKSEFKQAREELKKISDETLKHEELEALATKALPLYKTQVDDLLREDKLDAAREKRKELAEILPDKKDDLAGIDTKIREAEAFINKKWGDALRALEPGVIEFRTLLGVKKYTEAKAKIAPLKEGLAHIPASFQTKFPNLEAELQQAQDDDKAMAEIRAAANKLVADAKSLLEQPKPAYEQVDSKLAEARAKHPAIADDAEFKKVQTERQKKEAELKVTEAGQMFGTIEKNADALNKAAQMLATAQNIWKDIDQQDSFKNLQTKIAEKQRAQQEMSANEAAQRARLADMVEDHKNVMRRLAKAQNSNDIQTIRDQAANFKQIYPKEKGSTSCSNDHTTLLAIATAMVEDKRMDMLKKAKDAFKNLSPERREEAKEFFARVQQLVGSTLWEAPTNSLDFELVIQPQLDSLHASLKEVQILLKNQEFTQNDADGKWGQATLEAILKAQSKYEGRDGIKVDGKITEQLLKKLGWPGPKSEEEREKENEKEKDQGKPKNTAKNSTLKEAIKPAPRPQTRNQPKKRNK